MDKLRSFPDTRIKFLLGLETDVLGQVIIKVLSALEQHREHRLRSLPERKRHFITRDGRPAQMKPIHKLLITLLFQRHNISATAVGQMFGLSGD